MGSMGEPTLKKPWIETPLVESSALSRAASCRIFLKLDNLQPSGSFKSRGIGNLIHTYVAHHRGIGTTRPLHFYSSSGGNAGLACVTAARSMGYASSVVVPDGTDEMMIAKLKTAGATEVIEHGESWMYADEYLREVVMPNGQKAGLEVVYVPPFDSPYIWEGASSLITEIQRQMPDGERPDAIICSVGGGGLFCGIMEGLDKVGWGSSVQVIVVETKGAESLHEALKQGELITLPRMTSLAKSLGCVRVCTKAFELGHSKNVTSAVLSDAEACMGSWRLADDERILVEPACGVSVAPCYDGRLKKLIPHLTPDSKVVIIVCGGSKVSLDDLLGYRTRFGPELQKLTTSDPAVPSTHSFTV